MKRSVVRLVFTAMVVASFTAVAYADHVKPSQLKACHDHLWTQSKFQSIPNAGISVDSGRLKKNGDVRVHWRVEWDDMHARGVCVVSQSNEILEFKENLAAQDWAHGEGADFYFDTRSFKWKESATGQICHTCTQENGFEPPAVDGGFYYDSKIGKWRESAERGAICHSCTPENGFETPRSR